MNQPPDVWEPSPQEWTAYIQGGLYVLNLTYEQLEEQARLDEFSSTDAKLFWMVIKGAPYLNREDRGDHGEG